METWNMKGNQEHVLEDFSIWFLKTRSTLVGMQGRCAAADRSYMYAREKWTTRGRRRIESVIVADIYSNTLSLDINTVIEQYTLSSFQRSRLRYTVGRKLHE